MNGKDLTELLEKVVEKTKKETAKEIGNMLLNEVIQSIYTPNTEIVVDKQFLKNYIKEKYGVELEKRL